VQDDKLIGRGVEDNQQGLVSSVIASLALLENGVKPARTVKLLFAADEECGSAYGINALLELDKNAAAEKRLFHSGDVALIPDGGDSKGETIEIAEKNIMWLKFITRGLQAHGSRPDEGNNAFLAACDLALSLRVALHEKFGARNALFAPPYSTFEPTKKEANVPNVNTIPGEDVFCMDMRILPQYKNADVLAEVDRVKKTIEDKYRLNIEVVAIQNHESAATDADSPFIKTLSDTIRDTLGCTPRLIGIGGGTVGASLRNCGIDCAVWSPLDDTAHQPNEYALIKNILAGAQVMAALMVAT
jgi:succinyl-diaminopimelate desuccinylase